MAIISFQIWNRVGQCSITAAVYAISILSHFVCHYIGSHSTGILIPKPSEITVWEEYSILHRSNCTTIHYRVLKLCSMTDIFNWNFSTFMTAVCKIGDVKSIFPFQFYGKNYERLHQDMWNLWYRLKSSVLRRPQPDHGLKHHRIIRSIVYSCLPLFCKKRTNHCVSYRELAPCHKTGAKPICCTGTDFD